jgi:hypothetical protein
MDAPRSALSWKKRSRLPQKLRELLLQDRFIGFETNLFRTKPFSHMTHLSGITGLVLSSVSIATAQTYMKNYATREG